MTVFRASPWRQTTLRFALHLLNHRSSVLSCTPCTVLQLLHRLMEETARKWKGATAMTKCHSLCRQEGAYEGERPQVETEQAGERGNLRGRCISFHVFVGIIAPDGRVQRRSSSSVYLAHLAALLHNPLQRNDSWKGGGLFTGEKM